MGWTVGEHKSKHFLRRGRIVVLCSTPVSLWGELPVVLRRGRATPERSVAATMIAHLARYHPNGRRHDHEHDGPAEARAKSEPHHSGLYLTIAA